MGWAKDKRQTQTLVRVRDRRVTSRVSARHTASDNNNESEGIRNGE